MPRSADITRAATAELVHLVLLEQTQLSDAMQQSPTFGALEPAGKARAQRLALLTLRNLDKADRVLRPMLRKHPPAQVRNLLRQGVTELHEGASDARHGIVNDMVGLFRLSPDTAGFSGLANAVLRKAGDAAGWHEMPPQKMAGWLRGRVESRYGRKIVEAMEKAHARAAPLDLTPRHGDPDALARQVGGTALPTGSVRLDAPGQVTALPGYDAGDWWVQDAAAAIPARLLAPKAGEHVLDICAAPGGKTMQLAAAGANVTALDISQPRLERLHQNLARTGLSAHTVAADFLHWPAPRLFDAVLLDAPCSATGTLRRHPDLPYVRSGKDIKSLVALQASMLDRAVECLKPGGRLVFCTCSLLHEEGEARLAALQSRNPSLSPMAFRQGWIEAQWHAAPGALRLRPDFWPERGGMDGFFIAGLCKSS